MRVRCTLQRESERAGNGYVGDGHGVGDESKSDGDGEGESDGTRSSVLVV